jgi:hypothetical protein
MVKLDYACHELEAKKHLKEIAELLNKKKFGEAAGRVEFVIVELRMMKAAINSHIEE